jgi:nucleotide-binding universal stress UspA family protein
MSQIIVGVDGTERAADAVALATALARTAGAELLIAHAYPFEASTSRVSMPDRERRTRERAAEVMERHLGTTGDVPARTVPLPGGSPGRRLQGLAERAEAAAIVIGSSHRGDLGRVFAGTTAERLLHGAPCPVLVAPRGFRGAELRRILVGHDGGDEAQLALELALGAQGPVHLVQVFERSPVTVQASMPFTWAIPVELEEEARERFEARFARLGDAVECEFVVGDAITELVRRTEEADLAIVGSRAPGRLASLLLGSVSARLIRRAACPVMVVPRSVPGESTALLGARQALAVPAGGAS